ncbi:MAG TPA: hypothetical protein VHY08_05950 [Bacillota bacterium]|nr:hypothetical protein [Bacillota bacterium]
MRRLRSFITKPVVNSSESPLEKDAPVPKGLSAFKDALASRRLLTVHRTFIRTAAELLILLAIIFLTVPLVGQAAAPTASRFTTNAKFESNLTLKSGNYGLTMTNEKLTIQRSSSVIYTQLLKTGSKPAYCFYGPNSHYLLIKETKTTATEMYFDLWLVNLALKKPAKFSLQSNHFPIKAAPQLFVLLSPDNGKMVFSYFGTNLTDSKSSKIQDLKINSSETGAILCQAEPLTPAGPVFAETTSTGANIRMNNTISSDRIDLLITASPNILDFGQVPVGKLDVKPFTLINNGTKELTYTITCLDPNNNPAPTPNPAPVFIIAPTGGNIPTGTGVPIYVIFAPPSGGDYSVDLQFYYYDLDLNQNQSSGGAWLKGVGVTPTPTTLPTAIPTPTPTSTPTPIPTSTPTPMPTASPTPMPTASPTPRPTPTPKPTASPTRKPTPRATPTSRPTLGPIFTPTPTGSGVVYPDFLDIPRTLYALVSFPPITLPTRRIPIALPKRVMPIPIDPTRVIPTKSFTEKSKPDWAGIRKHLTSNAKINGMSIDQFITKFDQTVKRYECSYLYVTEIKASQDSATVTSSFEATARYKTQRTPTSPIHTVTWRGSGSLKAHFRRSISWLPEWSILDYFFCDIDNIEIEFPVFPEYI